MTKNLDAKFKFELNYNYFSFWNQCNFNKIFAPIFGIRFHLHESKLAEGTQNHLRTDFSFNSHSSGILEEFRIGVRKQFDFA